MKTCTSKSLGQKKSGNIKKSLHTLQAAAIGGKENLVGGRRTLNDNLKSKDVEDSVDKLMPAADAPKNVTAEDLMSEESPSEKYWEELAECRRVALQEALNENKVLHEKVKLLEEENVTLKEMINDSADIINYMNEIVEEHEDEPIDESIRNNETDKETEVPETDKDDQCSQSNSSSNSSPSEK